MTSENIPSSGEGGLSRIGDFMEGREGDASGVSGITRTLGSSAGDGGSGVRHKGSCTGGSMTCASFGGVNCFALRFLENSRLWTVPGSVSILKDSTVRLTAGISLATESSAASALMSFLGLSRRRDGVSSL